MMVCIVNLKLSDGKDARDDGMCGGTWILDVTKTYNKTQILDCEGASDDDDDLAA